MEPLKVLLKQRNILRHHDIFRRSDWCPEATLVALLSGWYILAANDSMAYNDTERTGDAILPNDASPIGDIETRDAKTTNIITGGDIATKASLFTPYEKATLNSVRVIERDRAESNGHPVSQGIKTETRNKKGNGELALKEKRGHNAIFLAINSTANTIDVRIDMPPPCHNTANILIRKKYKTLPFLQLSVLPEMGSFLRINGFIIRDLLCSEIITPREPCHVLNTWEGRPSAHPASVFWAALALAGKYWITPKCQWEDMFPSLCSPPYRKPTIPPIALKWLAQGLTLNGWINQEQPLGLFTPTMLSNMNTVGGYIARLLINHAE